LAGLLGVRSERPPLAELIDVSRWLASCSGCGMCEAACAQEVPIMQLVSALSHRIRAERHAPAGVTATAG
jgi:Na+-translocating ferredoxin:NAD+ oxidoreductase RnfC subunit